MSKNSKKSFEGIDVNSILSRYEELRSQVIFSEKSISGSQQGLRLLLHKGMVSWINSWVVNTPDKVEPCRVKSVSRIQNRETVEHLISILTTLAIEQINEVTA